MCFFSSISCHELCLSMQKRAMVILEAGGCVRVEVFFILHHLLVALCACSHISDICIWERRRKKSNNNHRKMYVEQFNEPNKVQSTFLVITAKTVWCERKNLEVFFSECIVNTHSQTEGRNMMKQKNVNCDNNAEIKERGETYERTNSQSAIHCSDHQTVQDVLSYDNSCSFALLSRWNWMLSFLCDFASNYEEDAVK